MRAAGPRLVLQRPAEDKHVVVRNGPRRDCAASSERTRSSNVEIEASVDQEEESSEENGNAGAVDGKKSVRTGEPRCNSQATPEGIRMEGRTSGEKEKKPRNG